jgi:rhodanese-related sulfurtransferase/predicted small lipoprotein YifL
MHRRIFGVSIAFATLVSLTACGDGGDGGEPVALAEDAEPLDAEGSSESSASGVRVVSVDEGAAILADPPDGLFVLDVRTPEEFGQGHLAGAELIDINTADFEARIAELDRDRPYLVYCRSGSRSESARLLMEDLGFVDVADVDGGITAWTVAGHPVVTS